MYELRFRREAARYLVKLPKPTAKRIRRVLDDLAATADREQFDVVKLRGRDGYRLRIGDYRVIYEQDDGIKVLLVERIAPRGDVYK